MGKSDIVQSVERAFLLLDILRESKGGLGIVNLAEAAGLKTTTTHRLLQTLAHIGVVQQDPNTRCYLLSPQILLYGKAVLDRFDFVKSAHPLLGELSKTAGETVFMGIHDNFELVYVDHVDSLDHVLRMTPQIGRRQPLHSTALGKVLLSHLPEDSLELYLEAKPLVRLTENTITDPAALRLELYRVREQGYSLDLEETEVGICCVGAPVWGASDQVIAAISVSGPATRMRKKGLETALRQQVRTTAEQVSKISMA